MRAIFSFLCLLLVVAHAGKCDAIDGLQLPECPKGCVLKIYGPFTLGNDWVRALPFIDVRRNIHDARPHLEKLGVPFPKGGWAWYFPLGRILIITVNRESGDMLDMIVD